MFLTANILGLVQGLRVYSALEQVEDGENIADKLVELDVAIPVNSALNGGLLSNLQLLFIIGSALTAISFGAWAISMGGMGPMMSILLFVCLAAPLGALCAQHYFVEDAIWNIDTDEVLNNEQGHWLMNFFNTISGGQVKEVQDQLVDEFFISGGIGAAVTVAGLAGGFMYCNDLRSEVMGMESLEKSQVKKKGKKRSKHKKNHKSDSGRKKSKKISRRFNKNQSSSSKAPKSSAKSTRRKSKRRSNRRQSEKGSRRSKHVDKNVGNYL